MTKKQAIQLFQERKVRTVWDDEQEKWYFSIVDVVRVLADSKDYNTARKYWNKLKQRLKEEGNETVTNCHQLKLLSADGKMRLTDVADQEQLFRLIQSIPSPKVEPFKVLPKPLAINLNHSLVILLSQAPKPATISLNQKKTKNDQPKTYIRNNPQQQCGNLRAA